MAEKTAEGLLDLNPDPVRSIPLYKVGVVFSFFQIFFTHTERDTPQKHTTHTQTTRVRGSRVAASRTSVVFQHSFMCTCCRPCGVMYMFRGHSSLDFLDHKLRHVFHRQRLELEKRTRQVEQRNHRLVANANLAAKGRGAMGICRRSLAMAVRGVQAALARLLRVDGHHYGLVGVLRRRRSGQLVHVPSCGA